MTPFRLVVVVGTDHHPFDRLIGWVDGWLVRQSAPVEATVQHGSARVPTVASARSLIPHPELQALIAGASAVVTHGGPATIVEARRRGLRPLVVPRDPAFGEHVDDHQQRFARRLAERGLIEMCVTQEQLVTALDAALANPASLTLDGDDARAGAEEAAAAVARVGSIIDALTTSRATA